MSQKRATITTRVSRAASSTPVGGVRLGAASPTSPARTSRLQEKEELQCLNDRLANYIDRMRHLESENSRLTQEVQHSNDTVVRETSNIKAVYERELAAARKLLDETSKEKAKLEIDIKRLFEEAEELTKRLDKKTKDAAQAENNARLYESRFNDVNTKYNSALTDRKKAEDLAKELGADNDRLRRQLDDLRKQLEAETLARVDLENQNQSLREELSFKDQIHTQELTEVRSRRQIEINEIDGRYQQEYQEKLSDSLRELREQYEAQMRANREELSIMYESDIQNLKDAARRSAESAAYTSQEVHEMRSKIEGHNRKTKELEDLNAALNSRIRELEHILDNERLRHANDIANINAELQRMRDEMAQQLKEYQDLMDVKVSLDLEIAAYDKLLCGEEHRLNLSSTRKRQNTSGADSGISNGTHLSVTSSAQRSGRITPHSRRSATPSSAGGSAVKRRRTVIDESEDRTLSDFTVNSAAKGDLQILEADGEGRYIKLHNKGTEEVNLTGWQLTREAGNEELTFKFTRGSKIIGGATITIWSADAGVAHEAPHNLVMKKKWPVADSMRSILSNSEKEDVASHDRVRTNTSSHASRHRSAAGSGFTLGSSTGIRSLFTMLF